MTVCIYYTSSDPYRSEFGAEASCLRLENTTWEDVCAEVLRLIHSDVFDISILRLEVE